MGWIPATLAAVVLLAALAGPRAVDARAEKRPANAEGQQAPERQRARIGIRYRVLERGLLVVSVVPGSGAERAGLAPGELVVAVDGEPVGPGVRDRMLGPAGTTVRLRVLGPLRAPPREVWVERGEWDAQGPVEASLPEVVEAFRSAVVRRGARRAVRAARQMVQADFGGVKPSAALGSAWAQAIFHRPRTVRSVLPILAGAQTEDAVFLRRLAFAAERFGRWDLVEALFRRYLDLRPVDVAGPVAGAGDLGGRAAARMAYAEALLRAGRRDRAVAVAREALRANGPNALTRELGLAEPATQTWLARFPPAPGIDVRTLDGQNWSLRDHAGHVVLLTFWATWCGPCRRELPELAELRWARGAGWSG